MDERRKIGVVVDAGHGGVDSGAVGNGLLEKDLNLKAANYMYDRLKELGVPVAITRTTDETLERNERVRRILNSFGNDPNVIVISNHINAGGGEGAEVVYSLRNNSTLANNILNEIGNKGQVKRKIYQRRLPEDPSKDYYFIQRLTGDTESILLEYGFIDNQRDASKLRNNLLDYVEGAVKAITEYAGYTYTPPGVETPDISNNNYYIVQRGDNLTTIANRFNTTVNEIRRLNNLKTDLLQIGQRLLISDNEIVEDDMSFYIVQKGDTLYSIANRFNTTVDNLKSLNNLTTNTLSVGQQLKIKDIPNTNTYIVQKGDSLYKIANLFNVSVNDIVTSNNLTSNILMIGQELIIPNTNNNSIDNNIIEEDIIINPDNSGVLDVIYTVEKGDSLYSIANNFNTTVDELIRLNNLTSNVLRIGQQLIIPGTDFITENNTTTYTVQRGDTLYSIANNYRTTIDKIIALNNLTSDVLTIGSNLIVPTMSDTRDVRREDNLYTVEKGDSLWLIAKKNNTTVEKLMDINNLKNINLQIGDVLKIPSNENMMYKVEKGDTIFSIATANNLTVDELKSLNNLDSNAVTVGQELIIS